jgi:hypothetical protein
MPASTDALDCLPQERVDGDHEEAGVGEPPQYVDRPNETCLETDADDVDGLLPVIIECASVQATRRFKTRTEPPPLTCGVLAGNPHASVDAHAAERIDQVLALEYRRRLVA